MLTRGRGWLPDPPDPRDLDAAEALRGVIVPPAASLLEHVKILDQGALGSCTANAVAQAVRISHRRQGIAEPAFLSRLALYWLSRAHHGSTQEDSGTFLRTAFSAMSKLGFCPESTWPYDDGPETFKRMPSFAALHASHDQKSPTVYRRISGSGMGRVQEIKAAVAAGFAVVFGTEVEEYFLENDLPPGPMRPPAAPTLLGHAMTVVGYAGDVFDIANSWGEDFGDRGLCYFHASYLESPLTRDVWIVESAPTYSGGAS